jgi:hypothetical protein
VFYLDVAHVCNGFSSIFISVSDVCFQVFQLFLMYVACVSFRYYKSRSEAHVAMAIHICFKCMFQMFQLFHTHVALFYLDVAYVAVAIYIICCKRMFQIFHLFQTYVAASSLCCKCFMSKRWKRTQMEVVPWPQAVPTCARILIVSFCYVIPSWYVMGKFVCNNQWGVWSTVRLFFITNSLILLCK